MDNRLFFLVISLYFYYMIGTVLEREWGTAKFNVFYGLGVVLIDACCAPLGTAWPFSWWAPCCWLCAGIPGGFSAGKAVPPEMVGLL